ncbi:MAG: hypothetical protein EXQ92_04235 [Alphaproteobacteria bacterium]|nr:hypothetical protein [Alphaproteobacteria bacterium]
MEQAALIRATAQVSVGRACMFGALGIWTLSFGFITWPVVALRMAAILTTLAVAILYYKAARAPARPHRRTEVWIMLRETLDLPEAMLQTLISQALVETFRRYSIYAAATAAGLWIVAGVLWLSGVRGGMVLESW